MSGVPLVFYLLVAALLFCIGLYATLARRNAIAILMGVELMLNAVNINLVAFWRFLSPMQPTAGNGIQSFMAGQAFTVFVFVVAAAEVAVGLALIISIYRNRRSVVAEDADTLRY
ncbi:MAG: NADH-quinone oxidoreductase subunit NuoK [Anaerolineae bacterium]|nr:NADH-quinone oxidoreductase subunit NuoK [Anaerolineae bacterium]